MYHSKTEKTRKAENSFAIEMRVTRWRAEVEKVGCP